MNEYYFKTAFGESGDRDPIPRPAQGDGSVSYAQGWGPDYQKNLKTQATAKAVSRKVTNQVMYAITQALGQYQRQGVPGFITAADNDGAPYAYGLGAEVIYNGQYWVSLQANNTTTPGTGNGWQTVLYRVATDTEVNAGTDSRTFIVPSNLKTQLDARDKTINQTISTLSQTVAQNKTDQGKINQATDETISQNKKDADAAIKKINDTTVNGKAIGNGNMQLSADDVGAIPLTGTNQQTGTIRMKSGTGAQVIPDNYQNFDDRYAASGQQNNNGFFRDNNTGFTVVWGIGNTSHNNDYGTVPFHRPFTQCFSVTCNVYGGQGTSQTSDKNLLIRSWNGQGFDVYAGEVETQVCYQAFGFS